ncbi:hypothetical protein [Bacillus cereus]|uniref:hypothetical protein n=1 Tax=Bacillus cereus TaxID=1396 RepID=UPI0039810F3E
MNVTEYIDEIIVDGERLSFLQIRTSNLDAGFVIKTNEKIKRYYDALWLQYNMVVEFYYKNGSIKFKIYRIRTVKDDTNDQYEYHFFGLCDDIDKLNP